MIGRSFYHAAGIAAPIEAMRSRNSSVAYREIETSEILLNLFLKTLFYKNSAFGLFETRTDF